MKAAVHDVEADGVEGRAEREDEHAAVPIIHLIAARLIDRLDLLRQFMTMSDGRRRKRF